MILVILTLTGCGLGGQSAVCAQYLDCYDAVVGLSSDTAADTGSDTGLGGRSYLEETYGAGGTCWSDPLQGKFCDAGCEAGLDILRDVDPLPAACE